MTGKTKTEPKNHLRAWRKFRHMTQGELADATDTTANMISQLESGARGLSDKWLRRLAPALGTSPGYLLDHDPRDLDADFINLAARVAPEDRAQAAVILRSFRLK